MGGFCLSFSGWQGQVETDETVQCPDNRNGSQQPNTPAIDSPHLGYVQAIMQHIEERNQVLAGNRPWRAPVTLTEFITRHGVDKHLVIARFNKLAGLRINAWRNAECQRFTRLNQKRHKADSHLRVACLDLLDI